jgi:hypothetical protein
MEIKKDEKKMKIKKLSPEQVEKAAETMGKASAAADNLFTNLKGFAGPFGSPLNAAIWVIAILALFKSTFYMIVFGILIAAGCAPMILKQVKVLKEKAEEHKRQKAQEEASPEQKTE